jgi:hypothetical protein
MEVCLLAPQCSQRHKSSACDKFKGLSLQHRRSVIAAKELCMRCLRHRDLDEVKVKECIRRNNPPHWGRDLSPVEVKVGRIVYACRQCCGSGMFFPDPGS